ncbi:hypothetical protein CC78DRAFT_473751 [Lojkania enalia]|uniref:T6SS Phospholipase effector Tle1-like catalytic domain-containing protein n=1 Tax=Lojkania enalia TaxID=147567 RepID=A0A9P4K2B7_9PLEO|nr:hypothetical protein CC78DRAFT_473751 [Didymosphaeria enalia]
MAPTSKRLFVCCDGTGNDAVRGQHDMISNVARFGRCLKDFGSDGIRQIVYYHEGVGMYDGKLKDGATGKNIHSIIQNAYYFICLNHNAGDEIHLIGFSRGALAVRALACFIEDVGILNKSRLAFLSIMYDLWRNGKEEPRFQKWDEAHLKKGVPITSCAVWDTVRALRTWNGLFTSDDLSFVETRVPKTLKNAFQALSLHETRTTYAPVLWHPERGSTTNVTQTWFAGDHSDVGGGHPDSGLATISLLWMVAQFKEYTNVVFEDIMLLDIMSPLYLHWQKSWLPWAKDEHGWQSHTYTKGKASLSEVG